MSIKQKQKERDEFIVLMANENIPLSLARLLISKSKTLHRLAEAQCNGDWPADNGQREVKECVECGSYWVPSFVLKTGICKECALQVRLKSLLKKYGVTPIFQGDPRGAVLKLKVPSGKTDDWGRTGVCVPV